jgi:hypothetical protein
MNEAKPLITVCVVNHNSSEFIGILLYALEKLTSNQYKVIIRNNNSRKSDSDRLSSIVSQYTNIELYHRTTPFSGSLDHGTALNELANRIDTEYGVIVDADATFLMKGWDAVLIKNMNDRVPIYGTQADIGGGKPEDFPLMFAMIFKTDIFKKLRIDFRPKELDKFQDTGWELREKYLSAGLRGGLLYDFNTRVHKGGPFAEVVCNEYYLSSDGKGPIVASHFGRGSAPKAKKLIKIKAGSNILLKILNRVLVIFNHAKWKKDKKRWIAICKQLVAKQSESGLVSSL